jgi:feruloyl esterase
MRLVLLSDLKTQSLLLFSTFHHREMMKLSLAISLFAVALLLPHVKSLVLPKPSQDCSIFAKSLVKSFSGQEITIVNSTLVPANSPNKNEYEYCQVIGKVAYASNDTLNFQVYLPDSTAYNGRFMAVGKFKFSM